MQVIARKHVLPVCAPIGNRAVAAKLAPRRLVLTRAEDPAAPSETETPETALSYAKSLPGITQPFPNIFDPANLLAKSDSGVYPVTEVKRWREAELVHSRVAMLAALGFLVGEQVAGFPIFLNVDGHVTGPAINHFQQVESQGAIFWEPVVFGIALCEAYRVSIGWANPVTEQFNALRKEYTPGELGFDPLGLSKNKSKQEKLDLANKELNNGRLAMIGIAGMVAQELVDGKTIFGHLGFGGVPDAIKNSTVA